MEVQSLSAVRVYVEANFRLRKFLIAASRGTTCAEIYEEVKRSHEELYPEDGEIYCQRLMLRKGDASYAVSTSSTLGDIAARQEEITVQAVMTYLAPNMRGPETTVDEVSGQRQASGDEEGVSDVCAPPEEAEQAPQRATPQLIQASSRSTDTQRKRKRTPEISPSRKLAVRTSGLKPQSPRLQPVPAGRNSKEQPSPRGDAQGQGQRGSLASPKSHRVGPGRSQATIPINPTRVENPQETHGGKNPQGSPKTPQTSLRTANVGAAEDQTLEHQGYTPSVGGTPFTGTPTPHQEPPLTRDPRVLKQPLSPNQPQSPNTSNRKFKPNLRAAKSRSQQQGDPATTNTQPPAVNTQLDSVPETQPDLTPPENPEPAQSPASTQDLSQANPPSPTNPPQPSKETAEGEEEESSESEEESDEESEEDVATQAAVKAPGSSRKRQVVVSPDGSDSEEGDDEAAEEPNNAAATRPSQLPQAGQRAHPEGKEASASDESDDESSEESDSDKDQSDQDEDGKKLESKKPPPQKAVKNAVKSMVHAEASEGEESEEEDTESNGEEEDESSQEDSKKEDTVKAKTQKPGSPAKKTEIHDSGESSSEEESEEEEDKEDPKASKAQEKSAKGSGAKAEDSEDSSESEDEESSSDDESSSSEEEEESEESDEEFTEPKGTGKKRKQVQAKTDNPNKKPKPADSKEANAEEPEEVELTQEQKLIKDGTVGPSHPDYFKILLACSSQEAAKRKGRVITRSATTLTPSAVEASQDPVSPKQGPKMAKPSKGRQPPQDKAAKTAAAKAPGKSPQIKKGDKNAAVDKEKMNTSGLSELVLPILNKRYTAGKVGVNEMRKDVRFVLREQCMFEGRSSRKMYNEAPPVWFPLPEWNCKVTDAGRENCEQILAAMRKHFLE